jgi:hypothetical protein
MIHLNDEYSFCAVFEGGLALFTIGDCGGGSSANGYHPGAWESLGEEPIAAINQYGQVFWADGQPQDYQGLANRVCGQVAMWDGGTALKNGFAYVFPSK